MLRYNDNFSDYGEINMGNPDVLNQLYEICYPKQRKKKRTPYRKGKHSKYAPNKKATTEDILM